MHDDTTVERSGFHLDRYPSVSEVNSAARDLSTRYPDMCRLRPVGTSRRGEEQLLLSVGRIPDDRTPAPARAPTDRNGAGNVLVVAGPHANERVGGATVLTLAEQAVHDPALRAGRGTGWHFLLCLDPDATRVNEPVRAPEPESPHVPPHPLPRARPPTLLDYHRTFFRPAGHEQPEWAPSLRPAGDELPESRTLSRVIDEIRPFLQCSLHANDVGGTWIQLTRDIPNLSETFVKSTADLGIPVDTSSIDNLYWHSPGTGIFVMPESGSSGNLPSVPERVTESTWYLPHRYGGMTAAIEAPMWMTWAVSDTTPHPEPRQAVAAHAAALRRRGAHVTSLLNRARPLLPPGHPRRNVLRGAAAAARVCPTMAEDWLRMSREPAGWPVTPFTAGQSASLASVARRIPLRAAAMLCTALRGEPGRAAAGLRGELDRLVARWCAAYEQEFRTRWVPVGDQVLHQSRMVTAIFDRLTGRGEG